MNAYREWNGSEENIERERKGKGKGNEKGVSYCNGCMLVGNEWGGIRLLKGNGRGREGEVQRGIQSKGKGAGGNIVMGEFVERLNIWRGGKGSYS